MKRRTLDLIFSIGGAALAVLLLVLGLVLQNQASFAKNYVHDQLMEQQITFTPVAGLSAKEKEAKCLVNNAGKPLTTGKQSECYANSYIGLHVKEINDGKTYAQTSNESRTASDEADAAMKADPQGAKAQQLEGQAKALAGKTDALFKGETLRGLLLTSYGFSIFGERAGQAALVAFLAAAVLALATVAGLVHALTTPKTERVQVLET
ncbi:MAG: hypothetical protein ABIP03_06105 [Aquihabitans sp.]